MRLPVVERVRFDQLRPLYDALDMIRGADPPTLRGALDYLGGRIAYGAHGHEMNRRVLQWAAKWARAGVTLEAVRERLRGGYNPRRNPSYYKAAWRFVGAPGYVVSRIYRRPEEAVAAVPVGSRAGAFLFQTEAPSLRHAERKPTWGEWTRRPFEWGFGRNPRRLRRRRRPFRPLPPPRRVDRPRHFHWNPDAEVMRHQLSGYHARGQRVILGHPDMDLKARVEKQLTGGPGAILTIRLDDPIGQEDYEAALGLYGGQARKVFEQAAREGRLNGEGRLKGLTVPWSYLSLDIGASPRGTLVEYQTEDPHHVSSMRDTPGRIVRLDAGVGSGGEGVVSMELFEPLNMWQLPPGMATAHVRPGGDLVESCEWTWVLWFIVPLWWGGAPQRGAFRPMREDLAKGLELEVFQGAEWLEGLA